MENSGNTEKLHNKTFSYEKGCSSNVGEIDTCRQNCSPRVTARIVSKELICVVEVIGISRYRVGKFCFLEISTINYIHLGVRDC
jgi:hypothetical protein